MSTAHKSRCSLCICGRGHRQRLQSLTSCALLSGEPVAEVPPADTAEETDAAMQSTTAASLLPDSQRLVEVQPEPLIPGGLNFLVIGAPLSGKSTQTHLLAERYDIPAITIDDLLLVSLRPCLLTNSCRLAY